MFKSYLDRKVDERIKEVFGLNTHDNFRKVPDSVAREDIKHFILQQKENGNKAMSLLDVTVSLNLPAEQVDKVLNGFERENKIKEIIHV